MTESRKYQLTFEERRDYLYANVRAEKVSIAEAQAYLKEIAETCRSKGYSSVLIDREIPTLLNVGDLFYTTDQFTTLMLGIKVAFVNGHDAIHKNIQFGITVAQNRGGMFSVHKNTSDAENWLLNR
jgi:hypothetical protein